MSRNILNNTIPGCLLYYHFHDHFLAGLYVSHFLYHLRIYVSLYNWASFHRLPFSFRLVSIFFSFILFLLFPLLAFSSAKAFFSGVSVSIADFLICRLFGTDDLGGGKGLRASGENVLVVA
jgi:hypothetical protein